MSKLTVRVREFRPIKRNTLVGFATIWVAEMKFEIREVAVHKHQNGARWVQLPSRPMVKHGQLIHGNDGKVAYAMLMDFDSRAVRDAFSSAVIRALLETYPNAFGDHCAERDAGSAA